VGLLETRTRELCAETLDPHLGGDSFDYVEECGARIPGMIIGALMGVPTEDQNDIRIWIDDMMRWDPDGTDPRKAESFTNIENYIQALVTDRRKQPRARTPVGEPPRLSTASDGIHRRRRMLRRRRR